MYVGNCGETNVWICGSGFSREYQADGYYIDKVSGNSDGGQNRVFHYYRCKSALRLPIYFLTNNSLHDYTIRTTQDYDKQNQIDDNNLANNGTKATLLIFTLDIFP